MANVVIVVGAQWGDEGKGRIIDLLTPSVDAVVRFQGGANAGHTVVIGDTRTVLHLVPSGILHAGCLCVIGNGVVLDPKVLIDEIEGLHSQGYLKDPKMLAISGNAHLVLPYHRQIDQLREERLGGARIGTTGRGIGPAYEDKASRQGIRFGEMIDPHAFRSRLEQVLPEKNELIKLLGGIPVNIDDICEEANEWRIKLSHHLTDTALLLNRYIEQGKKILFEGAQGTMLDIDHGTYPYVTSSNTVAGGACCGAGIGPTKIDDVLGIMKAYTTRVGEGPFPTEEKGAIGEMLQSRGKEFGATTGRKRRCGWFDSVILRYSIRVNGITMLSLTKLDVLTGINPLKICIAYEIDGKRIDYLPSSKFEFSRCKPIYEELNGWKEDITNIKRIEDLPSATRLYINRLAELAGVPIAIVSTGFERSAHIMLKDPFA